MLSYWDTLQKCYIVYKEFYISETSSCKISLPDPLRSDPATVIVAEEWQMIVDASVEIDFSEDQRYGFVILSINIDEYKYCVSIILLFAFLEHAENVRFGLTQLICVACVNVSPN